MNNNYLYKLPFPFSVPAPVLLEFQFPEKASCFQLVGWFPLLVVVVVRLGLGWDHSVLGIQRWRALGARCENNYANELPSSPCYLRWVMNTSLAVCEAFLQTTNAAAPSKPCSSTSRRRC